MGSSAKNKSLKKAFKPTSRKFSSKLAKGVLKNLEEVSLVVKTLRAPGGCPWDREQDHLSLRPYLLEEAYEVMDAMQEFERTADPKILARTEPRPRGFVKPSGHFTSIPARDKFCEELGDVLLQVLLHAQMASERGDFDLGDVAKALSDKLVFRHPHVFGVLDKKNDKKNAKNIKSISSGQVLSNWEMLKKQEKSAKQQSPDGSDRLVSALDGLPRALPSLQRASRMGEKAKGVGFDWPTEKGVRAKVHEEIMELEEALNAEDAQAIEHEMGDVFFALCNLSRWRRLDPEALHQKAIARFESRFRYVEEYFALLGKDMRQCSLDELDAAWEDAKLLEKTTLVGLTGGIASGKSTVAEMLRKKGLAVVDADQVSRLILLPGNAAFTAVVGEFGQKILAADGSIDRQKLGEIIFGDETKRKKLESLTHPFIGAQSRKLFSGLAAQGHKVIVYEATLLLEAGRAKDFKALILVKLPEKMQKKRLQDRMGRAGEKTSSSKVAKDAAHRLQSQPSFSAKLTLAQKSYSKDRLLIISNDRDLKSLSKQVDEALISLNNLFRKS